MLLNTFAFKTPLFDVANRLTNDSLFPCNLINLKFQNASENTLHISSIFLWLTRPASESFLEKIFTTKKTIPTKKIVNENVIFKLTQRSIL